jgi:cyclopropane-fatty-acyl-phospholipid synthase
VSQLSQENVFQSSPQAEPPSEEGGRTARRGASWNLERWLIGRLLAACGNPPLDVRLWDGVAISSGGCSPTGTIVIGDRSTLWQLVVNPIVGFGDGFSEGAIQVRGALAEVLAAIEKGLARTASASFLQRFVHRRPRRRSHTVAAARDSVHHHYDIGNDFYRLWLDERMQYTCAYYAYPACDLEAAQFAKLEHVCRKLRLQSGERVLEAGCGWGGLALHMAERYGVTVRAFNLSHQQVEFARDAARGRNLASRIEFVEDDYRNATGTYDAFVSVGMLEHVGLENYGELGRVIERSLTPAGRGLLHSIGRNRPQPLNAWTDKRIFPGAYPPSLCEMLQIFEPIGFSVLDVENLRLHYARTLEHWLERFERAVDTVTQMFDERFVRMWRMYLAASVAAFQTGSLQLFQVVFARESINNIPWTRHYLYWE